jgi:hypothetical protein
MRSSDDSTDNALIFRGLNYEWRVTTGQSEDGLSHFRMDIIINGGLDVLKDHPGRHLFAKS